MIEVWKHINTYDPDIITPTFQLSASARRAYQVKRVRPGDGVRGVLSGSYFAAPIAWNRLPAYIAQSETMNIFKQRLDKHWADLPLKYNYLADPPFRTAYEDGDDHLEISLQA